MTNDDETSAPEPVETTSAPEPTPTPTPEPVPERDDPDRISRLEATVSAMADTIARLMPTENVAPEKRPWTHPKVR